MRKPAYVEVLLTLIVLLLFAIVLLLWQGRPVTGNQLLEAAQAGDAEAMMALTMRMPIAKIQSGRVEIEGEVSLAGQPIEVELAR